MKTLPGFEVEARKWASGNISPCSLSIFTCVYVLMCICACTHMGVHTCIHWSPKITAITLHCSSTPFNEAGCLEQTQSSLTIWASLLWESLVSCLTRLELQGGHHACLPPAWVPGYKHWSSSFPSKYFATKPSPSLAFVFLTAES